MSFYSEMPKPFIEVIETADKGYWKDYSSPARRQWEEEQKKARNEKVSSSPSKLIL
jgi:hypothetical protein